MIKKGNLTKKDLIQILSKYAETQEDMMKVLKRLDENKLYSFATVAVDEKRSGCYPKFHFRLGLISNSKKMCENENEFLVHNIIEKPYEKREEWESDHYELDYETTDFIFLKDETLKAVFGIDQRKPSGLGKYRFD